GIELAELGIFDGPACPRARPVQGGRNHRDSVGVLLYGGPEPGHQLTCRCEVLTEAVSEVPAGIEGRGPLLLRRRQLGRQGDLVRQVEDLPDTAADVAGRTGEGCTPAERHRRQDDGRWVAAAEAVEQLPPELSQAAGEV